MVSERKRRRAARRVQPGDGHELKRYRWWQPFTRSLFHLPLTDEEDRKQRWSVDVRPLGDSNGEIWVHLYRDGLHYAGSKSPAVFQVPGGSVEVVVSGYGLKRCHYVTNYGAEHQLVPEASSAEGRRARLQRNHPVVSRAIGVVSIAILVVALVLGVPQIIEQISHIPPVADRFGTFTSPVNLPAALNIGLVVAALVASTERALRLRYNWLLDGGLFDGTE